MRVKAQTTMIIATLVFLTYLNPVSQAIRPRSKAWAFMVYSCADCDLEGFQLSYLLKMAMVGSTADVDIVVQMDRIEGYSSDYGNWTDCKRFYVTQGLTPTSENAISSLGEVNMGSSNTLSDFLTWSVQEYPADRYFAMIIGHGWLDGVCPDWSNSDILTPLEIQWALRQVENTTGVAVDVIAFEACQQSALEIAYEIGDYPAVLIASEEVSTHWPYRQILSNLTNSPTMNLSSLASMIVDYYAEYSWRGGDIMTIAAMNVSKIHSDLETATTDLANVLSVNIPRFGHAILTAISNTEPHSPIPDPYAYSSCRDLYDFASKIEHEIPDSSIQLAAQTLISSIEAACLAEWHGPGHPNFHGLYIYLPENEDIYHARVSLFGQPYAMAHPSWTQDSTWDDFLFHLFDTYAPGLRTREQIVDFSVTSFDSDNDSYLDGLHLTIDLCTTGEPMNITAHGSLIDPQGYVVNQYNDTWTVNSAGGLGDIYLSTPSDAEEGWYSAEISVYDKYGIFEDNIYLPQIAFLPEKMHHDMSVYDIVISKTVVGQGYPCKIEVTVFNTGHYDETSNITTYVNGTLTHTASYEIPSKSNTTLNVQWNTTSQSIGNYTVTSYIEPVDGENITSDNFFQCDVMVCVTLPGDIDADLDIDIFDIVRLADTYGTTEGQPSYEPNCDINGDGKIDIFDIVIAAGNYGKS